jgi:3D-(3,5/4)-trihydroxycyclohexane-1,2-dione acylhydrolase (decyclizing)
MSGAMVVEAGMDAAATNPSAAGREAKVGGTLRLTAAQAMMRWLSVQMTGEGERFIEGVWAIFGHGNVAGVGEALHGIGDALPTWRGQNEQTMSHAAIAYAKTKRRRRAHAVTSSIGPGATNMVTAAALAHVNRLPVLFIPGDVFANRRPDPVLQQVEDFDDGTVSANDCFRPVVRYFDRISRPEHLLTALPRAFRTMTDPVDCGPVCLAFCQDVQAEAFDYPESFFAPRVWRIRRPEPDAHEVEQVVAALKASEKPVIVAGGGVLYSEAEGDLLAFAKARNIPLVETQAGKGAVDWREELNFGAPGVTGSDAANGALAEADLVLGIGTRFQDFTTGSWTVFANPARRLVSVNLAGYDAAKHGAIPLVADAKIALARIDAALGDRRYADQDGGRRLAWFETADAVMAAPNHEGLPTDAQVIGAVQRVATERTVAMCAAGTMPGALQVLWRASPGGYHMEYGYSCMGYEVAGALGIKLAAPQKEVICFVGDGSYMMANSELATAVMRRIPFTVVLTDNRGYGCINRLQIECGGAEFNNMYKDSTVEAQPQIDFVAHAASMGAYAQKVEGIADLESAIVSARGRDIPSVLVIDTDAAPGTGAGGHWWDVAVPQAGRSERLDAARRRYRENAQTQRVFD